MTTTTDSPPTDAHRPLPLWASVPIILACLAGGAGIIYCYVGSHVRPDEARVLGDVPTATAAARPAGGGGGPRARGGGLGSLLGGGGGNRPRVQVVRQDANGVVVEARTPRAVTTCAVPAGRTPTLVSLKYQGGPESPLRSLPADVQRPIDQARKLVRDDAAVTALKLTDDQRRRLRGLGAVPDMHASDADRAMLVADFKAYQAAPQDKAATAKLLADVDAVSDRSVAATRQEAADRATKINALVTPEQWKQYAAMGG